MISSSQKLAPHEAPLPQYDSNMNQIALLKNQISALKQIIQLYENSGEDKASVLTKWREEVFKCLLKNKRYEALIETNVNNHKKELS